MPKRAIISDKNKQLINVYRAVKQDWQALLLEHKKHSKKHSQSYYYEVRARTYGDTISQAAQFICLNGTCWNGLYRVNKKGDFNVPIGTKNKVILDADNFEEAAKHLKKDSRV